jgi:hypothetical protein
LPNCQIAKLILKVLRMKKKKQKQTNKQTEGSLGALAIWHFGNL